MENKQFDVDTVSNFIRNLIKLTNNNDINWEIKYPKYDESEFSQTSFCTRLTAEMDKRKLILVSKDTKFNFEVIFKYKSSVAKELPLVEDDTVQKELKNLYMLIVNPSEVYNDFNGLFNLANFDAETLKNN